MNTGLMMVTHHGGVKRCTSADPSSKFQGFGRAFPRKALPFSSVPFVFFPGGDPAADMALGLVFVEYLLDLPVQPPVDNGQTLTQIFMYGYR